MGLASKSDRFTGAGLERLGKGGNQLSGQAKQFDRLELFAKLNRPPAVKFKDLEELVTHKISVNVLPFDVRTDFIKVTSDTVLVPVTVQIKNKDVTFVNKDGVQMAVVNIFGRITTMTGRIARRLRTPSRRMCRLNCCPRRWRPRRSIGRRCRCVRAVTGWTWC